MIPLTVPVVIKDNDGTMVSLFNAQFIGFHSKPVATDTSSSKGVSVDRRKG